MIRAFLGVAFALSIASGIAGPATAQTLNMMKSIDAPDEHLWIPVINAGMYLVTSKKLKGARPHMIYQNTFYKGLDLSL